MKNSGQDNNYKINNNQDDKQNNNQENNNQDRLIKQIKFIEEIDVHFVKLCWINCHLSEQFLKC